MIEHINIINELNEQIAALLDLMASADKDMADIKSVNTASEMCLTMLDDLMVEIKKIETEWKGQQDD